MAKRILLTGATGFVGSGLANALGGSPDLVLTVLTRSPTTQTYAWPQATADLTDADSVAEALSRLRPDVVVHAAGRVHGKPLQLFTDNTVTTIALADAIRVAVPTALLIALGSAAEYGRWVTADPVPEDAPLRPVSPYGHAKVAAEAYLAASAERGLRHNLLRVFNLVGRVNTPAQVVGAFIAKAAPLYKGNVPRIVELGRLDAVRDFVTIDDLGAVIVRLIERGDWGHVLNVCSGKGRRVRDLIAFLVARSGRDYQILERGDPPTTEDVFIGDPTRMRDLTGLTGLQPIEAVLTDAWQNALRLQRTAAEDYRTPPP